MGEKLVQGKLGLFPNEEGNKTPFKRPGETFDELLERQATRPTHSLRSPSEAAEPYRGAQEESRRQGLPWARVQRRSIVGTREKVFGKR